MRWEDVRGQDRAVRLLRAALDREHVHHAYLFAGPDGVGKERTARIFAEAANCEAEPARRPCGECANCRGIERGNFPDVSFTMPQAERIARGLLSKADLDGAPSKEIRVDEVRELSRRLSLAALRGRRKVAIVVPADALNERAQNTLLKTLEEPPPATTFVLISASPDALLPTIRSRCARVAFGPVPEEAIVERLVADGVAPAEAKDRAARAEGSFSRALAESGTWKELIEAVEAALDASDERDALDVAERLGERDSALDAAKAIAAWTRDVLVAQAGGAPALRELSSRAAELSARIPPTALLRQAQACSEAIEALEQNGNGRLQLERLLLRSREVRRG